MEKKLPHEDNQLCKDWSHVKARYKLVQVLGKGSFGRVIFARIRDTKKEVAIKYIKAKFTDIYALRNIIREVTILR